MSGALLAASGCPVLAASPSDQAKLISADTGFAFGLLKELAKEQPAKNVFISPYSISTLLQMVANGAAGSTRDQMAQVLGTSGLEAAALNQAYKDVDTSVRSAETNVALNIANAIWYSAGIEVKPAFASLNKEFYGATMDALDFAGTGAGGIVNAWAEKNTSGRIKNIVGSRLPADTRMLLANAIYFKGSWDRKFDPKATKERPFHLIEGGQAQVSMMQQSGEFEYQEGNGCQAVRLPYAGRRLGMYVLLPEPGSNLQQAPGLIERPHVAGPAPAATAEPKGERNLAPVQTGVRSGVEAATPGYGLVAAVQPRRGFFRHVSQSTIFERGEAQELCRGK